MINKKKCCSNHFISFIPSCICFMPEKRGWMERDNQGRWRRLSICKKV